MTVTADIRKDIDAALHDVEQLADEVRLKLHLAGMEAREAWTVLEPRLEQVRHHAKEAGVASRAAIEETRRAILELVRTL